MSAILALGYNIIAGLNPSGMEQAYNEAALAVRRGEIRTRQELFERLRHLYVDDADFKVAFGNKRIRLNNRTRRVVHFLLSELESELSGRGVDREGPAASVEHLLPQVLTPEWARTFPAQQQARSVDRLANYTLLEPTLNRRIGAGGWEEKRVLLESSSYALAREASEVEAWEPRRWSARGGGSRRWPCSTGGWTPEDGRHAGAAHLVTVFCERSSATFRTAQRRGFFAAYTRLQWRAPER